MAVGQAVTSLLPVGVALLRVGGGGAALGGGTVAGSGDAAGASNVVELGGGVTAAGEVVPQQEREVWCHLVAGRRWWEVVLQQEREVWRRLVA